MTFKIIILQKRGKIHQRHCYPNHLTRTILQHASIRFCFCFDDLQLSLIKSTLGNLTVYTQFVDTSSHLCWRSNMKNAFLNNLNGLEQLSYDRYNYILIDSELRVNNGHWFFRLVLTAKTPYLKTVHKCNRTPRIIFIKNKKLLSNKRARSLHRQQASKLK